MRVTVDIPENLLIEIERERKLNAEAENPEQRRRSESLESFLLYLVEIGEGEL
jgi:hypothetical protein